MTLKEAARLFRSLKHYERLSEGIPLKRTKLVYLIEQYHIKQLCGL